MATRQRLNLRCAKRAYEGPAPVPEAHVEVIDLVDGSRTMKAVLAEHLDQPADELSINIKLA